MQRFLGWLRMNRAALAVATGMFAIMASVMAIMLEYDFWGGVSTLFTDFDETLQSPFLWVWRIGGMVTWPVFMWMLLAPFRNPNDPQSGTHLTVAMFLGAIYGGFGMLLMHMLNQLIILSVGSVPGNVGGGGEVVLALFALFAMDVLSIAYTWGFCAIYALVLQSLTGRRGRDWMLPSFGFTILGRWVGPAVISVLIGVVSSFILSPLIILRVDSFLVYAIPIAIALSTGNFAGQWLAFWNAHDHVLGIVPMPQTPYGQPYQGQQAQTQIGGQPPTANQTYVPTPQQMQAQPQPPYGQYQTWQNQQAPVPPVAPTYDANQQQGFPQMAQRDSEAIGYGQEPPVRQ